MKRIITLIFLFSALFSFGQTANVPKTLFTTWTFSSTDDYSVTETLPATYSVLEKFIVQFDHVNTGPARFKRAALAFKPIVKYGNVALVSGDIDVGIQYTLSYDGTSFQIVGDPQPSKTDVGLGNVDNTSDANKPVSTAQSTAINAKVADAITDGVTTIAPSQNAVFDALALKAPLASPAFTGNPTATTQTAGDNSTKVATTAYVDLIRTNSIGNIYNETFSNLSSYTNVGTASASASSGVLTLSGGSGAFSNYLYRTSVYTSLDLQYRQITFTSTVNGATGGAGEGVGIGWRSRNVSGGLESVIATFNNAAVTNRGQVLIKNVDFVGSISTIAASASNLSYTNGDVITMKVIYNNTRTDVYVVNVTTGTSVSVGYSSTLLTGSVGIIDVSSPAIYPLSGTVLITNDVWGTYNPYNPYVIHIGNSIVVGGLAGGASNGFVQMAAPFINGNSWVSAASVNGTQDAINSFNDIIIGKPKYVTIYLGTNDALVYTLALGTTTTPGTHLFYMKQLIDLCNVNNITPIILYSLPVAAAYSGSATINSKINSYNAAYQSAFPGVFVVNINAGLVTGSDLTSTFTNDNIHPSSYGHALMRDNLLSGLVMLQKSNNYLTTLGIAKKFVWNESTQQFTFGTTNKYAGFADYAGGGEFSAGTLTSSALGDFNFFPSSSNGAAGASVNIGYFDQSIIRSAVKVSNTGAGFGTLSLMTSGGIIATGSAGFTGTNLSGTNTGDQTTVSGNAGSATILQTSRNIDGVAFNGSANILTRYSGNFSGAGTATTVFTVTIGATMANNTYEVNVTPTAALSAALFYVTNKTTTTFDVTYLAGLTGTVLFDWLVTP